MIKIILPAKDIPLNRTVCKLKGTKEYRLTDKIVIYGENKTRQEIKATEGCRFIVSDGTINAIRDDEEVIWITDHEELMAFLDPEEDK